VRISCQDFAQKGQGVTFLCEQGVVKGNLIVQSEESNELFSSEQGGFLCNTITHLPRYELGVTTTVPHMYGMDMKFRGTMKEVHYFMQVSYSAAMLKEDQGWITRRFPPLTLRKGLLLCR